MSPLWQLSFTMKSCTVFPPPPLLLFPYLPPQLVPASTSVPSLLVLSLVCPLTLLLSFPFPYRYVVVSVSMPCLFSKKTKTKLAMATECFWAARLLAAAGKAQRQERDLPACSSVFSCAFLVFLLGFFNVSRNIASEKNTNSQSQSTNKNTRINTVAGARNKQQPPNHTAQTKAQQSTTARAQETHAISQTRSTQRAQHGADSQSRKLRNLPDSRAESSPFKIYINLSPRARPRVPPPPLLTHRLLI